MPTFVPFVALLASGCALSGALLAWIALERRRVAQHGAREREKALRDRSRYAAYQHLERHLQQTVTGFGRREGKLLRALATQKENLGELLSALDEHEGQSDEVAPDEAVRWMEEVFEPRRVMVAERDEMAAELAGWETRLQHMQDEKQAELGRQSTLIQQLTDRVRDLEPLASAASAEEKTSSSADLARLQAELQEALEIAGRVNLAEAARAAALGEQAALRAQLSVQAPESDRIATLRRERDEAVSALEARTAELVRMRNGPSPPHPQGRGDDSPLLEQELERLRSEATLALAERTEREAHLAEREAHFGRELGQNQAELDELRDTLVRTEARITPLTHDRDALIHERNALVRDLEFERTSEEDLQRRLQEALDQLESGDQAGDREVATIRSQLARTERELEELTAKLQQS